MVVVKEFNKRCPRAGCHDSGSFEVALQQVLQYQQVDVAVICPSSNGLRQMG